MTRMMIRLAVAIAVAAGLAACNTIKGAGKDIEKAGQAIEGAASK
jgi:predicted small secreted protein